jgi:hypothetical protein
VPHRRAEQGATALQRSLQRRTSRSTPPSRRRQKKRQLGRGRIRARCGSNSGLAETSGGGGFLWPRRVPRAGRRYSGPAPIRVTAAKTRQKRGLVSRPGTARRLRYQRATRGSSAMFSTASGPRLATDRAALEPLAVHPSGRSGDGAVPRGGAGGGTWRPPRAGRANRIACQPAGPGIVAPADLHLPAVDALGEAIIRAPLGTRRAPRLPRPQSRGTGVRTGRASE